MSLIMAAHILELPDPERVGSWAWAQSTGVTPPAHQAGDYLIAFAMTQADSTQPDLGSGFTDLPISLGANAPALRACYKVAGGSSETCTGFTNAQQVYCGVYRNVGGIVSNAGFKQAGASDTTINWLGLTLAEEALVIGVVTTGNTNDPALRSDLTEAITNTLGSGQGRSRIGESSGMQGTWGATTSTKTVTTGVRAISFEIGLYGL